jgi:hypothetical protein
MQIRIKGRISLTVFPRQGAIHFTPPQGAPINNGGAGLQPHPLFQPIKEDAGDPGLFRLLRGFLFYNGSQDDDLPFV